MSGQTRHVSCRSWNHPISKNSNSIDKVKSLRTLLHSNKFIAPSIITKQILPLILSKLKYLRVLSFHSFDEFDSLPDSIGKLIHLRYLDLSLSMIKTLPESLCDLYNLQTLKLIDCSMLTMLPNAMHNLLNLRHLDITGTRVQEIPIGISKLKRLHLLGRVVVFQQMDSATIKELGESSNLAGRLDLTNLENVTDCDEAVGARLMDKTRVNNLMLKWWDGDDIVSNRETERDILDKLQPHHGLKKLEIDGYRGATFPIWVGHSSYSNMTSVSLMHCRSCHKLPSLGQLSSLKTLVISYFDKLENIGVEFYKSDDGHSSSASPFPSLERLTFESMPCWEVWSLFDSDNAFTKLEMLEIIDCPRLKGDLPNHLPALKTLRIEKSDKVGLQELPLSLATLLIGGCQQVESMCRVMSINHPTHLDLITISNCLSATPLPWDCLPQSLTSLSMWNCRKLEFGSQQQKHKLEKLELEDSCDSLSLLQLEAFPELKRLDIIGCENLESFSLSEYESHPMYSLEVYKCKKLKSLPSHMNTYMPNLTRLHISGSPDIDSFPEGGLPPSLKALLVINCGKLVRNLSSMGVLQSLTFLYIDGHDCGSIKSFPNEGLLHGLPSLTKMSLIGFPNLETLEFKELLRLNSLQELQIGWCPKLENIAGERLPHSLLVLYITECPLLAKRCNKKHKQIWPKISHIPDIIVDHRLVS